MNTTTLGQIEKLDEDYPICQICLGEGQLMAPSGELAECENCGGNGYVSSRPEAAITDEEEEYEDRIPED